MPPGRKELHQVMELAMDVTAHCHRAVHRLHVRLLDEDLLHLEGQRKETLLHIGTHILRKSLHDGKQTQPFPFIYLNN